jgi:hypothetical protein
MSKDMTDQQQRVATSQPTATARDALRTKSKQTAEERWVQDALEHDDVRECLKLLHARGKNESDSAA